MSVQHSVMVAAKQWHTAMPSGAARIRLWASPIAWCQQLSVGGLYAVLLFVIQRTVTA